MLSKKAVAVAKRNDADLHLVHVVDTRAFQNISSFDTTMVEEVTDTAKKTLDKYVQEAKDAGVTNVDYAIEYGAPKTIIARDVPQNLDIDLIMIGATGSMPLNGYSSAQSLNMSHGQPFATY